eukprot:3158915-Alexandrium_andersonii.AAC.1
MLTIIRCTSVTMCCIWAVRRSSTSIICWMPCVPSEAIPAMESALALPSHSCSEMVPCFICSAV